MTGESNGGLVMIKNIVDWLKFALKNPLNRGSLNDELQRAFKKEEK